MGGVGFWKKVKNMYIINHQKENLVSQRDEFYAKSLVQKSFLGRAGKKRKLNSARIYKDKRLILDSTVGSFVCRDDKKRVFQ